MPDPPSRSDPPGSADEPSGERSDAGDDDVGEDSSAWHAMAENLPEPLRFRTFDEADLDPHPIQAVVSDDVLERRIAKAKKEASHRRTVAQMQRFWPELHETVIDLLPPGIDQREVNTVSIFLMLTLEVLGVTKRRRAAAIDVERLRLAYLAHTLPLIRVLGQPGEPGELVEVLDHAIAFHAQPNVARWLSGAIMELAKGRDAPRGSMSLAVAPFAVGTLLAALWEIEHHPPS